MFKPVAATLTALALATAAQASTFTSYYGFGDSLSDDGKLGLPEPYVGGRFSTGPTWVEIIQDRFDANGLDNFNFALGGATAGDVNENTDGDTSNGEYPAAALPFANLNAQIDTFSGLFLGPQNGDNPLISVLMGANDIFQGQTPADAANFVADGIQRLIDLGPQFNDFAVSNLPFLNGGAPGDPALTFNAVLGQRLESFALDGINIMLIDQPTFTFQLFPQLPDLGITNVTEPCLIPPTATTTGSDCTIIGFEADGTPIRDLSIVDTFYLIDESHPTGPVQAAFGEFAIAAIGDGLPPAVPLPAGGLLLLSGLWALAYGRRRQTH